MNYTIIATCPECGGSGYTAEHLVNPRALELECTECQGQGVQSYQDDMYDTLEEVLEDYPEAVEIQTNHKRVVYMTNERALRKIQRWD